MSKSNDVTTPEFMIEQAIPSITIKGGLSEKEIEEFLSSPGKIIALPNNVDIRYNEPKGKPKASDESIDKALVENEIYRRAKEYILNAEREQIAYGLDKYPETLNHKSWSIFESIDHIIAEGVDKLHYQVMLRIQLEELFRELNLSHSDDEGNIQITKKRMHEMLQSLSLGMY